MARPLALGYQEQLLISRMQRLGITRISETPLGYGEFLCDTSAADGIEQGFAMASLLRKIQSAAQTDYHPARDVPILSAVVMLNAC